MNILIPDSWLREFLKTKATPQQIKEYLSLCGPSVERIHEVMGEPVYDVEITSNRPDAMSIIGMAREAAAILPRFGIKATLTGDPYSKIKHTPSKVEPFKGNKKLSIKVYAKLCPRFTAMVFENVKVAPSPEWLVKKLGQTGIRSINNVVDITNYLMRAYGQPAHVFDYDAVTKQTMILRASKKGESITTLDGKTHTLPGDDIVIEDGSGKLIDLCGIMGAENSSVKETTTNVILFLQTYDPIHIRRTSMSLAHRTEASVLFEKGIDAELVMPVFYKGIELMEQITGGSRASKLYDIYPKPFKPYEVSCSRKKIDSYIGTRLADRETKHMLSTLGFSPSRTTRDVTVMVPSYRRDVTIDVDIIEEIARMYGYHNISVKLPDREPPVCFPEPILAWEEEIKIRLRDWGYMETYTYSMISEKLMETFGLDKTKAYIITNPLSNDWVYMRPSLIPSMLSAVEQNLHVREEINFFELSMIYEFQKNNLPVETPMLVVALTGHEFFRVKGIAEAIFTMFGVPFPTSHEASPSDWYDPNQSLLIDGYGSVGEVSGTVLAKLGIKKPVTVLELNVAKLVLSAKKEKTFEPIPKYPPVVEDVSFIVPAGIQVGPIMEAIQQIDPLIVDVTLFDVHEASRAFHITYLNPTKNLTMEDVKPIREKIIAHVEEAFNATVKTV